jgi:ribonucleoside-diphosphate reductase subunit M1
VWAAIVSSQIETGSPYITSKDSVNRKNAQAQLGVIKSSNLCNEVVLYTSPDEIAVCNLASINLAYFADADSKTYDFQGLANAASRLTVNLNHVIDRNYYPVPETRTSNMRHRPIGVGTQGLADTFFKMRRPFESAEALQLSADVAEAIYFGCVRQSVALAKEFGAYSSYEGSPASQGKLQFHLWDVEPSDRFDWSALLADLKQFGLRNSTLTAQMPTSSTSAILGKTESVEALCSNCYVRRTGSGEYVLLNQYLVDDLILLDLWTPELVNQLVADGGSVQQLDIPDELKELYKTVWETKQRALIDQAKMRGPYIDMSQSMNLFIAEPSLGKITSAIFYAWHCGLKSLVYYLRSRPKADPIQITIDKAAADKSRKAAAQKAAQSGAACTREMMQNGCESCSG